MCQNDPQAQMQFPDFPFTVQRFWSNAAAKAKHDPCVPPLPSEPFFNAVPELPDTGPFNYFGTQVTVSSVHIPVGGSKQIYLDLYSDATVPAWQVSPGDFNVVVNGADPSQALLTFDWSTRLGKAGDAIPVTITVKAAGNPNTNGSN